MLNIISYLTTIILAGYLSLKFYSTYWWLPIIIIPILLIVENKFFYTPKISTKYKNILDNIITITMIAYIGVLIYLFYVNIGWLGIILGLVLGYLISPFIAPARWRYSNFLEK